MVDVEKLRKKRNAMMACVENLIIDCENWIRHDVVANKIDLEISCGILKRKVVMLIELTDDIVDELNEES